MEAYLSGGDLPSSHLLFFWTIKISSEKAETNQWESTGLISVVLDKSNLSQKSLVVVYHLCTPKHGAIDRRLACDAKGAKQVLRRVGVCIQSVVIQVIFSSRGCCTSN